LTTTQDEPSFTFFKFEYFANLGHYYHRYFAGDENALDIHDITFHLDPLRRRQSQSGFMGRDRTHVLDYLAALSLLNTCTCKTSKPENAILAIKDVQ